MDYINGVLFQKINAQSFQKYSNVHFLKENSIEVNLYAKCCIFVSFYSN